MAEAINKRKKTTSPTGDSPPSKHPHESSGSNDPDFEDTATSKPTQEEIELVHQIDNIDIMQAILAYRSRVGVYPFHSQDAFESFCHLYTYKGVGNDAGWKKKMEEMKNKFSNESDPKKGVEKKEFKLWKQIWGNERKGDDDPGVDSSK